MILFLTETLTAGGAEIFILRLARHLKKAGVDCIVFNYHGELVRKDLLNEFSDVEIIHFNSVFDFFLLKLDRLFLKLRFDFSVRQLLIARQVSSLIRRFNVQVIHSHLFKVDYSAALINNDLGLRHIITNHGDYQLYHSLLAQNKIPDIISFTKKARYVFKRTSVIICISNQQKSDISSIYGPDLESKIRIIYNGLSIKETQSRTKAELNIPENSFVFGMVARGIKEKGWAFALEAFNMLNNPNAHLIFVGDGEYLREEERKITNQKNVHWVGFSQNSLEWIHLFDVGLLPSFYKAESQPNVILECLSLGKPVISSNVGDVGLILNVDQPGQCGQVVGVRNANPEISVSELYRRMEAYMQDAEMLSKHSENARQRFKSFDMDSCARKYMEEYFPMQEALLRAKE